MLVLGVDAGSALVEARLATLDGIPVGTGRSGSANPTALPVAEVARHLGTAVGQALAGIDPDDVECVVVGAAGVLWFSRGPSATALALGLRPQWFAGLLRHESQELVDRLLQRFAGKTTGAGRKLFIDLLCIGCSGVEPGLLPNPILHHHCDCG